MTDADVERIARRLCAIRGVDPDEKFEVEWFDGISKGLSTDRWTRLDDVAKEVRAWAEVQQAMVEDIGVLRSGF